MATGVEPASPIYGALLRSPWSLATGSLGSKYRTCRFLAGASLTLRWLGMTTGVEPASPIYGALLRSPWSLATGSRRRPVAQAVI